MPRICLDDIDGTSLKHNSCIFNHLKNSVQHTISRYVQKYVLEDSTWMFVPFSCFFYQIFDLHFLDFC